MIYILLVYNLAQRIIKKQFIDYINDNYLSMLNKL